MTNELPLPKDYEPFPTIIICGNTLINVRIPFEIDGQVPLLIGDDGKPKIWLNAPPPKPSAAWHPIVRANRSLHKAATVVGAGTETVLVKIGNTRVLSLRKRSDGVPEVNELDLRPLGLNIHGDTSRLIVGTSELVNNTFTNVYVMVGIGDRK